MLHHAPHDIASGTGPGTASAQSSPSRHGGIPVEGAGLDVQQLRLSACFTAHLEVRGKKNSSEVEISTCTLIMVYL